MLSVGVLVALTVAGCSSAPTQPSPTTAAQQTSTDALLAPYGLTGSNAQQLIERLESMPVANRPATLRASVHPTELQLTDSGSGASAVLPLPAEHFHMSIAPYAVGTHECFFHSLTTCKGELGNQDVHVTITDKATGKVLIDETRRTFDNGYVAYWLPSGTTVSVRVEHGAQSAVADLSTGPEAPTCITTMKLS
jgi:hypothetical protein